VARTSCGPPGLGSPPELSLLPLVESRPPLVGFVPAVRTSHHGSRRDPTSGRRTTPPPTPKHAAVASVAFRVTATERPLPRASLRASVPRSHPRDPVPSSWFRTTSTGSSARRSRACCIPLPVMGFAAFRVADFPGPRRCSGQSPTTAGRTDIVPAAPLTPPEGILASSRTTSPWPLPPCRSKTTPLDPRRRTVASTPPRAPRDRPVDFEALLRRRVRTTPDRCRPEMRPVLPWALLPSKVLPGRPHPSGGPAGPRVRVHLCRWRNIRRQLARATPLRSAPSQRPLAAGPAHPPCG
jgi:hypothetical protein